MGRNKTRKSPEKRQPSGPARGDDVLLGAQRAQDIPGIVLVVVRQGRCALVSNDLGLRQ